MKRLYPGSRLLVGLLWCLHWLPLPVMRAIGAAVGSLLFRLARRRRRIAETNLRLCFPALTAGERAAMLRRHFTLLAQSVFDRPYLWWASEARLRQMIKVRGIEHLDDGSGRPAIVLLPHFVGLDACGVRLSMDRPAAAIYRHQSNPVFDATIRQGRLRFAGSQVVSKREGMRRVVRILREGVPFIYPADMDFGPSDAVFVPFFGVDAATVTALPKLAAMTNARVVPLISHLTPEGYVAELLPAWENFPGDDPVADARRFNAFVETQVLRMPEQYYWVHKRFKTRPPGVPGVY
jgi:KDO2-lipid IV(A) lauroyltransferase